MKVIKDLIGGGKPNALDAFYNGAIAANGGTLRYKGSLVNTTLYNDIDYGMFWSFGLSAGATTAMANFVGILEEEVLAATGNGYAPNNTSDKNMIRRRITPCFPSTIIQAEYVRADDASVANYDTGATLAAASKNFTVASTDTDDANIGQWIYFYTGANAGYLHYVEDSDDSDEYLVFAQAGVNAVVAGDYFLAIQNAQCNYCLFNATGTGLKSEVDSGNWVHAITGLNNFISAPGIPFQFLDRDKHDGINVGVNARFYHQFTIPLSNLWTNGMATS